MLQPFRLVCLKGICQPGVRPCGISSFKGSFDMQLAALIAPACFLWGAAIFHAVDMVKSDNFAPGSARVVFYSVFYSDILLPFTSLFLLWVQRKQTRNSKPETKNSKLPTSRGSILNPWGPLHSTTSTIRMTRLQATLGLKRIALLESGDPGIQARQASPYQQLGQNLSPPSESSRLPPGGRE